MWQGPYIIAHVIRCIIPITSYSTLKANSTVALKIKSMLISNVRATCISREEVYLPKDLLISEKLR